MQDGDLRNWASRCVPVPVAQGTLVSANFLAGRYVTLHRVCLATPRDRIIGAGGLELWTDGREDAVRSQVQGARCGMTGSPAGWRRE